MARPTDKEHAAAAARHVFAKPEKVVEARVGALNDQGVHDEASLGRHTHDVMTAPDTQCFRGAVGRESYANDRMNTIVHTRENRPESNSVYHNDERDKEGGRSASERLGAMANAERRDHPEAPCEIRTGGSRALEVDRPAMADGRETREEQRRSFPPPPPTPQPQPSESETQTQGRGR